MRCLVTCYGFNNLKISFFEDFDLLCFTLRYSRSHAGNIQAKEILQRLKYFLLFLWLIHFTISKT